MMLIRSMALNVQLMYCPGPPSRAAHRIVEGYLVTKSGAQCVLEGKGEMTWILGIVIYVLILAGVLRFFAFVHQADERIRGMLSQDSSKDSLACGQIGQEVRAA